MTGRAAPAVHVERTGDPAVMRWVCHHPALGAAGSGVCTPPAGSPLGALLADGRVTSITVEAGDLLVRAADAGDWPGLAPLVHDAVVSELGAGAESLAGSVQPAEPEPPSVEAVQAVVDRAVGSLAAAHGGLVEVADVGAASVTLRLHGACRGCRWGHTTGTAATGAIRRALPQLTEIDVEDHPAREGHPPATRNPLRRSAGPPDERRHAGDTLPAASAARPPARRGAPVRPRRFPSGPFGRCGRQPPAMAIPSAAAPMPSPHVSAT